MNSKRRRTLKDKLEDPYMMPMRNVKTHRMKLNSSFGGLEQGTLKGISLNPRNRILSLFNKTHITDELACYTITHDTLKGKDDRCHGDQTW